MRIDENPIRVADDAIARHKNRDGISAICRAHRPRGLWVAELVCKLAVGTGLPERYVEERFPDLPLKGRSLYIERHRENGPDAGEVFVQLFLCSNVAVSVSLPLEIACI